jgi:hypothetical protein
MAAASHEISGVLSIAREMLLLVENAFVGCATGHYPTVTQDLV